jgi:hypothetical protein
MRYFAGRLMVHAAQGEVSENLEFPTALPVLVKLRPHLTTLMGSRGFQTLVVRALALAGTEVEWMTDIRAKSNGAVEGFEDLENRAEPAEITRGSVILVASLLSLLVAFIGELLTLHLLRDIWPQLPDSDNFTQGDNHEK